jgi:predicted permease
MRVDLFHLFRSLGRAPASALAAIVTLSLTLGVSAAIFALVDAVLLTPPPFAAPEALFIVGETSPGEPTAASRTVSYATFEAWRERAGSMATLEASDGTNFTLTGLGPPERVSASYVTPRLLSLLGVTPTLGRDFTDDDVGQRVAIISHDFWRANLGLDPRVLDRQIVLGNQPHVIVGVLSERYSQVFGSTAVWLPFPVSGAQAARAGFRVGVTARLAPTVAAEDLTRALDQVSGVSSPPAGAVATPITTWLAGDATRPLALLIGAAALAVLIAFTNLAGLLIVRSIDRRRELAVRSALGARRFEIARQLLLEAAVLVAIGTAGGVLLAAWVTPALARVALDHFGGVAQREPAVSWRVVIAMAATAAVCATIASAGPGLVTARRDLVDPLRRGATTPPRELLLSRVFIAGVVALAFVLLVSVLQVGTSLLNVLRVHPGFDAAGVLSLQLSVPVESYPTLERVTRFYATLQTALEERLGAGTVSVIDEIPLTGDRGRVAVRLQLDGLARDAIVREPTPGYFEVMRIPLIAGRTFQQSDTVTAPPRVLISRSLATALFPSEDAVGRVLWLGTTKRPAEIVGVVGDVKHRALDETAMPTVYLSGWQTDSRSRIMLMRTARADADTVALVREEVARLDRTLPVYNVRPLDYVVGASPGVPTRRMLTAMFTGFALLAAVLGAIGLFGMVAHDVARRRTELALRLALGADMRQLLIATLRQGGWIVTSGLIVGTVVSFGATRVLSAAITTSRAIEAFSLIAAALVLIASSIVAMLPAARHATRTDPVAVLRAE